MATVKGAKGKATAEKTGHDEKGRFTKGNRCATGRKVTDLRRALLEAVTLQDMADIAASLITAAQAGDLQAAALLFDRVLGKPMTTQETELYTHEYDREDFAADPLAAMDFSKPRDQIRPLNL